MIFKEINLESLEIKPFDFFKNRWALLTAGNKNKLNTMTISWGSLGTLWEKNISFVFVRPQRYTFEFIEKENYYSICFLGKKDRNLLNVCGTKSGRNSNKIKETGLSPVFDEFAPYFNQSEITFICKKIHGQFFDPKCFIDKTIHNEYKTFDYHKIFIGEVKKCLVRS